jgi:hypothetical protein
MQGFFSEAFSSSPVSRTRSGEWSAITKRTQRESPLDFCVLMFSLASQITSA